MSLKKRINVVPTYEMLIANNDKSDLFLKSLEHYGIDILELASNNLMQNKKFLLKAIKKDVLALDFVQEDILLDQVFLLDAVKKNGLALQFLPSDLTEQNNKF